MSSERKRPTVSVVIPCYNGRQWIQETIQSVLNQSYPIEEVIVVDDGSTDNSAELAQSFGKPVRVMSQLNQGESVARNRGIDEATGDWVALLDADDLWTPDKIEKQIAQIEDGIVCIYTNFYTFGIRSKQFDYTKRSEAVRHSLVEIASGNAFSTSSVLLRGDIKTRFPTWTSYGEDAIFFLDLLSEGRFKLVPEFLNGVRTHSANQTAHPMTAVRHCNTFLSWAEKSRNRLSHSDRSEIRRVWTKRATRAFWSAAVSGNIWLSISMLWTLRRQPRVLVATLCHPLSPMHRWCWTQCGAVRVRLGQVKQYCVGCFRSRTP